MTEGRNIERLLERYVSGELHDSDRELVEQYLTGSGEDSVRAREDLHFEKALSSALEMDSFHDDVAGVVLDRVYRRRITSVGRGSWVEGAASKALKEALEGGKIAETDDVGFAYRLRRLVPVAAAIFILVALVIWNIDEAPPPDERRAPVGNRAQIVGRVIYASDSGTVGDDIPALVNEREDEVRNHEEVSTDAGQMAVVHVTHGGGQFKVIPGSRVQIVRPPRGGAVLLRILNGGIVYDFSARNNRIDVETVDGRRGKLHGRGRVVLASHALSDRPTTLAPALYRLLVVRIGSVGRAEFDDVSGGRYLFKSGETGVVGPESAVKLAGTATELSALLAPPPALVEAMQAVVRDPDGAAMTVGSTEISRERVAREAMRVHSYELFALLIRTFVLQIEVERLGIKLSAIERTEAENIVMNNEPMQVSPLRSRVATGERVFQVAALLAIHRRRAKKSPARLSPEMICEQVWANLARHLVLEQPRNDPEVVLRMRYQGKETREINRRQAWEALRRFLRASEMERVMSDLAQRALMEDYLRRQGKELPQPEPMNAFQALVQASVARMSGLTFTQARERETVRRLLLPLTQVPSAAQVDRFLMENLSELRRLNLDHYFFPFTDAETGVHLGASVEKRALDRARALVLSLSRGGDAPVFDERDLRRELPWQSGPASGPKPWWREFYGRDFVIAVLNLEENEVSEPIRSDEGYHVVKLRRAESIPVDAHTRRLQAQSIIRAESVFDRLTKMTEEQTVSRTPAAELLE